MVTGYLRSRKVILGITAILLLLSVLLYSGILQVPHSSPRLASINVLQQHDQQVTQGQGHPAKHTEIHTPAPVKKEPSVEKPKVDVVNNNGAISEFF